MARKRKDTPPPEPPDESPEPDEGPGRSAIGRQINVRIQPDLLADLAFIGDHMGLDMSAVIRMILTENRRAYVLRIERRLREADRDEP